MTYFRIPLPSHGTGALIAHNDTFVVRAADVLSAGLVWVGIHALGDGARSLAYVNVALVVLWIVTAAGIAHRRRLDGLDRPTRTTA